MFKRTLSLSLILFFTCLSILYKQVLQVQPQDFLAYQKLFEKKDTVRLKQVLQTHPLQQKRTHVQKDIWAVQKNQRLHFRLQSEQSDWIISQQKGKIEAVEHLKQLTGYIQDEIDLEHTTQRIRTFTADQATYFFPSHRFLADTVHLAFFDLPGTDLPSSFPSEKPFLKGIAYDLDFTTTHQIPSLHAYHLQVDLDLEKGKP